MPCMDNDVLRRGKPTVHVKYGEAPAMLARQLSCHFGPDAIGGTSHNHGLHPVPLFPL